MAETTPFVPCAVRGTRSGNGFVRPSGCERLRKADGRCLLRYQVNTAFGGLSVGMVMRDLKHWQ